MTKAFLIPGLGADKRIYKHIEVGDFEVIGVDWLEPDLSDTLATYAQKLAIQYQITPGSVVIGNSLGGMLAVEIAHQVKLDKVILISSIKSIAEAPFYFKVFKWLPVQHLIPGKLFAQMGSLIAPLFGKMYAADAYLFNSMLQNTSPMFIKWAMGAVLKWQNKIIPANLYHIIGNNDFIFNHKNITGATIINGGTHVMIFDRAKEINQILSTILKRETT